MLLNKTFLAQDKLQAVGGLAPHASIEHQLRQQNAQMLNKLNDLTVTFFTRF